MDSSSGGCDPYGSGVFTFSGTVSANLVSTSQLRMTLSGVFEIAEDVAVDTGVNLSFFSSSVTVGQTRYYRDNIYTSHIETT